MLGARAFVRYFLEWIVSLFLYFPPPVRVRPIEEQWIRHRTDHARIAILYFHGNAGLATEVPWLGLTHRFDESMALYAAEYPGYGNTQPLPTSEKELFACADAAWCRVLEDGFEPEQIILWGRSLGSAPASYLASTRACGGLVLHAAFASIFSVVNGRLGRWMRAAGLDVFDNASRMRRVECPVAIVHSTQDDLIRYDTNAVVNLAELPSSTRRKVWPMVGNHQTCPNGDQVESIFHWLMH